MRQLCEAAGAVEKVPKTILRAAMMLAEHPTAVGRPQEVAQKPQAAIEVTCIV
jgi:hypothetical protein